MPDSLIKLNIPLHTWKDGCQLLFVWTFTNFMMLPYSLFSFKIDKSVSYFSNILPIFKLSIQDHSYSILVDRFDLCSYKNCRNFSLSLSLSLSLSENAIPISWHGYFWCHTLLENVLIYPDMDWHLSNWFHSPCPLCLFATMCNSLKLVIFTIAPRMRQAYVYPYVLLNSLYDE